MSSYAILLGRQRHVFDDLKTLMAAASPEKSGDRLAGIAADTNERRVAARYLLADVPLRTFLEEPLIPYEIDEVTRLILDGHDAAAFSPVAHMTVGQFRDWLLSYECTTEALSALAPGLTPEMVAAVSKIMRNHDLIVAAAKASVATGFRTTIGLKGRLSSRLQPNHPTDNVEGILASVREGLSYGIGDAVIGLNPVDDTLPAVIRDLETLYGFVEEWQIPTQISVLAHITTQLKALRKGAPVHLLFQSIAGTEAGNKAFGIDVAILDEAYATGLKEGKATGPNIMYFETGQGSELSAEAHNGADQVPLEARCYGLARHYKPYLVNTVVGFIGPEYLYDTRQVTRAGLEDHFMGKLTGLPMGVDACYTNHMKADQNDIENLAVLLTAAGCTYFMGVPLGDDVMLNYQCTSFHDTPTLRDVFKLRPLPEFECWLEKMGIMQDGKLTQRAGDATIFTR